MKIYLNLFDWYLPVGGFCRISQRPLVYSKYFIQAASSTVAMLEMPIQTHQSPIHKQNIIKQVLNSSLFSSNATKPTGTPQSQRRKCPGWLPMSQHPPVFSEAQKTVSDESPKSWQLEHLSTCHCELSIPSGSRNMMKYGN